MAEQYFKHTPQALSDHNQVENLAIEVEEAFLKVENDLWGESINSASIGSSIGDLDTWYLRNYSPDNGIITSYEQDLYFPKYSKEASLDLVPDSSIASLNQVVIKNRLNPSQVYTYKHDGKLESEFDFCFVNRKIIVGLAPTNGKALTISYNGYEPVDTSDVGLDLRYNVLQTIVDGQVIKEFTNTKIDKTYKISGYDFKNMCSRDMINVINNHPYNLEKFVSVSNVDSDESYSVRNIAITNSYISFEADAEIPEKVKIYVANSNLGKLLEGIYRLFYSHNHGSDGGNMISHSDLVGLFNNTSEIKYSVTAKENYDHPQYLNREGYIEAPEVYNNAMLGDLLISSKDDANYYNNLSDDSFKIVFGEYASGHRISYSKDTDSLVIDSLSRDGVKLVSPKDKNILELNEHIFTDTVDGEYSGIRLSIVPTEVGAQEIAVFSIKRALTTEAGVLHEDSAELHVFSSTFSISKIKDNLNLLEGALLSFGAKGDVQLSSDEEGIKLIDLSERGSKDFYIGLPTTVKTLKAEHVDAKNIHITNNQKIVFGNSSHTEEDTQYLNYSEETNQVVLDVKKPLKLKQNGYDSGIALNATNKVFASNAQGTNTTNTSERIDTYVETSGGVYLIDYVEGGQPGAVNLQSTAKANLYAGDITANNISVVYGEGSKNALKLNGETHKIFAQKDAQGNTGIQIQSSGGVNIVNSYLVNGSNLNIEYGTIRASEFRTEGGGDSSGFYGNLIVPTGSTLTVNGKANINSDMELNTNLSVKGVSKLNTLETSTVKAVTVSAAESIVTPLITAPLGFESKLYFGADTVFNNSVAFKQVCTFTSNCDFSATLNANTINTKYLNVTTAVDFPKITTTDAVISSTLQFKKMLQSDNNTTSEFSGPLLLKSGLALDRSTTIRLGSADITSTRNTSGVLITENTVKLGNNSSVKATKLFANKGMPSGGNSDLVGGYSFETNLGASDGDTGLFCTDKGTSALADDLVFYINGEKRGEISSTSLDLSKGISGREKTLVTAEMIKGQFDGMLGSVLSMVYPVGSVYINANDNRNPKEILNWTTSVWARFAVGMTLVGAEGSTNSEKMAAMWNKPSRISLVLEKEFGAFEHQLTLAEMPKHSHDMGHDAGGNLNLIAPLDTKNNDERYGLDNVDESQMIARTGRMGEDKPHNNVQPSVVVAMWRRIG